MNNLSDQEKSALLAKLCGWYWAESGMEKGGESGGAWYTGSSFFDDTLLYEEWVTINSKYELKKLNLYDPANMALLAKVIEFIISKEGGYLMLDKIPEEQIYTSPHSYLLDFFDFEDFHKSMCEFVDRYLESEPHNTKDE